MQYMRYKIKGLAILVNIALKECFEKEFSLPQAKSWGVKSIFAFYGSFLFWMKYYITEIN